MALPKSATERELLRLRARVAELEAEVLVLRNGPNSEHFVSSSEETSLLEVDVPCSELVTDPASEYEELEYGDGVLEEENPLDIADHVLEVSGEEETNSKKKLPCPKCGKRFAFNSELTRHISTHTPKEERDAIKRLECSVCGKRFDWNCDLRRHVITHGSDRPHQCAVCGRGFKLPESLKKHMTVHSEGRNHQCTTCNKQFKNLSSLRKHTRRTHLGLPDEMTDKSVVCNVCGKILSRPDLLIVHKRSHTGERPYKCSICDKGFVTASKVKSHQVTHGNRPYLCRGCGHSFSGVDALQNHAHVSGQLNWTESVAIIDLRTDKFPDGTMLINMQPCVVASESCTSESSELSSPENHRHPGEDSLNGAESLERNTQLASSQGGGSDTPLSLLENADSSSELTSHQMLGSTVYAQLLRAVDKDGRALVQLHVQPREEVIEDTDMCPSSVQNTSTITNGAVSDHTNGAVSDHASNGATSGEDDASSETQTMDVSGALNGVQQLEKLTHLPLITVVILPGNRPPPCPICNQSCNESHDLTEHLCQHKSEKPHRCTSCSKGFDDSSELEAHQCSQPCSYACQSCSQSFTSFCALDSHSKTQHRSSLCHTYQCQLCGKSYPSNSSLRYHLTTHMPDRKRYSCEQCDKTFTSSSYLAVHTRSTHMGERPFSCEHCDKTFVKKSQCAAHTRTHTGEKHPHQCKFCNKTFPTSQRLKIHVRTHTGERPFKCQVCGCGFYRKFVLTMHIRSHTGEKPYKCEHCDRRFKCKTDCRRHQEDIHEGKRYTCKVCGKLFKRGAFRKHMVMKHQGHSSNGVTEHAQHESESSAQDSESTVAPSNSNVV